MCIRDRAYYALVRALKPRVVLEAGAARGLGTCIIDAALRRNAGEGYPGKVHAVDIEPHAGCLIRVPYDEFAKLSIEDSERFLRRWNAPVDLFLYDIVCDAEIERRQYEAIANRLTENCVLLSVWTTGALREFAACTGRRHITFRDEPLDHWHPGCRIAIAYQPCLGDDQPGEPREYGQTLHQLTAR